MQVENFQSAISRQVIYLNNDINKAYDRLLEENHVDKDDSINYVFLFFFLIHLIRVVNIFLLYRST